MSAKDKKTNLEQQATETPVMVEENSAEVSLNDKINFETTIKDLQDQITKIKANEKQLMLATKLNTIKELEIQNQEHTKYANQKIIKNLVHALLNFQRALNFKTENKEVENFLVGFKFIYDELIRSLEHEGLKEITAQVGEEFNSHKHDAVEIIKDAGTNNFKNTKNNTIIEVIAKGYELHNRVISTIKVKVFQTETKDATKKN
ncbi:nucleotide exchange factor GrpE [Spiroplasma sp. AdecLV25b]|uniref:nucleotide exchange factor GrpE n=1 Tax=Spiroplasma sp. AdecLV25b TaxID=3027162 RepID=UPI0027E1D3AF|nr:nucleotide exchange factor GrpE [Spiroplasma sp. AdecLV25b]